MQVSVLMPVYNGADHLAGAVSSILAQTLTDFELLIVNDGSTDATLQVARSFNDPRIRIIDLETNQGLINALNTGLAEAKGEFLARMDHDDIAHPARFQQQIRALEESGAVICGSAIQPFGAVQGTPLVFPMADADIRAVLPVASPFAHPAVTMRTDVCQRLGYAASAKHCEDYDLWWRFSEEGTMANLREPLLRYRFHASQISAKYRELQIAGTAAIATGGLAKEGRYRHAHDLQCHNRALSYAPLASLDELDAVGNWLNWLRNTYQVNSPEVSSQYSRVWRRVCSYQAHLGYRLWGVYKRHRSPNTGLQADAIIFLAAYGRMGAGDKNIELLRRVFRR